MWLYNKLKALFFPVTEAVAYTTSTAPTPAENVTTFAIKLLKAFGYSLVYFFFLGALFYFIFAPVYKKLKKVYENHGLIGCVEYIYKTIKFSVAYVFLFIKAIFQTIFSFFARLFRAIDNCLCMFPRLRAFSCSVIALSLSIMAFLCTICVLGNFPATQLFIYHTEPPEQVEIIKYKYVEVPVEITCECDECLAKIAALNFQPRIVLSDEDRWMAEAIVCGEAGNQSYLGQQLVAQCLWDAMNTDGLTLAEVRARYGYEGYLPLDKWAGATEAQKQSIKDAVSSIFDREEFPVEDNILYFYSTVNGIRPNVWHETGARFVIWEGQHRFFAKK